MKIIIFGISGMLGKYLYVYLKKYHQVIGVTRKEIDALTVDITELNAFLKNFQDDTPTYVINCVGIIPQRTNLDEVRKFIKVNTLFPHLLACCCQNLNFKMIHVTTDCVFTGLKGDYTETDIHDETNIYGTSKSLGEPKNCCVIRTSIIGEEINNKKSLLEWVLSQNHGEINGYVNHIWNGVTCLQLAKIIDFMIYHEFFWDGVRHIYSPNKVSKYELIQKIIEIYQLDIKINKFSTLVIDKSLVSIYPQLPATIIPPDIGVQLLEQKNFKLY